MSFGYGELTDDVPRTSRRDRRSRRRKKRGFGSFMAVLLSLSIFAVVGWYGYNWVNDTLGDWFSGPEDFEGAGVGSVEITIPDGSSLTSIGNLLFDQGVVASSAAFVNAAEQNPDGRSIQPGTYSLMKEMPAEDAVNALLAESNRVQAKILIPEGFRLQQIVNRIAGNEDTDFAKKDVQAVVEAPGKLDLPSYAEGTVEGFLFPATYDIEPGMTAKDVLNAMAGRFGTAAESVDLVARADQLGLTPLEVVTVASIVQREVRTNEDMPNVAQVVYNRLSGDCRQHGVPQRRLQMDSTVHYAVNEFDEVATTEEQRQSDSPYNTYRASGLPPGPIASPGESALRAALNPSGAEYCYFVTVDLETGETKFATTEDEHAANVAESRS